jgi:hypothetical protein
LLLNFVGWFDGKWLAFHHPFGVVPSTTRAASITFATRVTVSVHVRCVRVDVFGQEQV